MLFPWISLLASVPISTVLALKSAGQVPIRNGVIGGVGNKTTTVKAETLQSFATTPGKLRVTENSGICGELRHLLSRVNTDSPDYSETTKNVYQASGYGDLTSKESILCATFSRSWRSQY